MALEWTTSQSRHGRFNTITRPSRGRGISWRRVGGATPDAPSFGRARQGELATKASKEKKKKTAEAAKSPIKKKSAGKKKAEKQQQNLLVPYKLPGSGEILFVRSSEIEKLHGIDGGHGTRSELKMLLGRALRQ